MSVLYFSILALSLFLFFPMQSGKIALSLIVLIVISSITESRGKRTHRWIFIIQFAWSVAVVVKTYQQYNFFICILSLFICVFLLLLMVSLFYKEDEEVVDVYGPLPAKPNYEKNNISLNVIVNKINANSSYLYDEYECKVGYFVDVSRISSSEMNDHLTWNQALLEKLHEKMRAPSKLAGRVINESDVNYLSSHNLYAFYNTKRKIKGLQSGELSLVFEEHALTAIRIIENTCRGRETYELTLETCEDRVFLDDLLNENHRSDLDIHKFAILLAKVWKIPLEYSHINMN